MSALVEDGADAYVFVIPGSAFNQLGFNHNYRFTRRFNSASSGGLDATLLPDDPARGAISPFAVGIWTGDSARYAVEREAELIRRETAPDRISRLDGVFFFADLESCQRVNERWGWDLATVRHGKAVGSIDRYDMIVSSTLMPPSLVTDPDSRLQFWQHYFSGAAGPDHASVPVDERANSPIWEYLVAGFIQFDAEDASPFSS